jgi:hypothetical protein
MKRLAFFSIVVGTASLILGSVACEDSEEPSKFKDTADSSGDTSTPSFNTDGSATNPDVRTGPVVCNPSLPSTFSPTWRPPTKTNACTTAEIGEYFEACAPDPASAACTTWVTGHATCSNCIEPDDNTGPIQLYEDRRLLLRNTGGCVAIGQNDLAADKCGAKVDATLQCSRESCFGCFDQVGAQITDFQTCQNNAARTGCTKYDGEQATACGPNYTANAEVAKCYPTQQEVNDLNGASTDAKKAANKSFFTRVINVFCGPPT